VKQRDLGFTLLEVLIAMALFGLMLSLVFSTLHMAARAWEAGEPRAAALTDRMVVERFLREQLGTAMPWSGKEDLAPLEGEAHTLSFTTFLPFQAGVKGPQRITISHHQDRVEIDIEPVWGEMPESEKGLRHLQLLDHVKELQFRYFTNDSWRENWTLQDDLPDLVAMTLTTKGGYSWPPLFIELRYGIASPSTSSLGIKPFDF